MLFERRPYNSINYMEKLSINGKSYRVTLGQKCNHPEVRVNGKEYRNDIGIFDVKADSQYLRLYYYKEGSLNAMRCAPRDEGM